MTLRKPPHRLVATVLGAGTMGAQIAAHLANAGVRAHLLDIVPKGVAADAPAAARNAIVFGALKALKKSKPPALMTATALNRITPGNLEDDLENAVSESDLVIEAVVERLDIKRDLFARVAAAMKADTILATNTSGIPIGAIADAIPEAARPRLLGLHFFNPPRFMHLLEVIPSAHTDAQVVEQAADFCDRALGKGVVHCRDTPNFIGNRIGIAEMLLTFDATQKGGYTIEEVDVLNGTLMGRPRTGSYRLGDMVGLDVVGHVVRNLAEVVSDDPTADDYDPLHALMKVPEVLEKMFERKMLGDKTKGGFYKKTKDESGKRKILSLDLSTLEYRDQKKADFPELRVIKKLPTLERKIHDAVRLEGRSGDFIRAVYLPLFNYAAALTGRICDTPKQIDDAMCWGYGWKLGPFALMDAAGPAWVVEQMKNAGLEPAAALAELAASGDDARWYPDGGHVHVPGSGPQKVAPPAGVVFLKDHHDNVIHKTSTAALLDIGDGVACVEFRSKMNIIDEGVVKMLDESVDLIRERGLTGLVVGNQGDDFCVGANIMQMIMWIMQKQWTELEGGVKTLQDTFMKLRHGDVPVVVAPYGRTLGGGVELSLHGDRICAGADLFMGLVEIGLGVLPAGGGLKEICRRASEWARQVPEADPYDWVRRGFEAAATAKVSMSAFEAREAGFLADTDRITFHRNRVIADAKAQVLGIAAAGYTPPDPDEPIDIIGAPRGASFLLGAQLFEWGGYASEHDKLVGEKIAHILSGGMGPTAGTCVAQDLLDLEREAFVSLCGEAKTLARMQHMLEKGKPLRN